LPYPPRQRPQKGDGKPSPYIAGHYRRIRVRLRDLTAAQKMCKSDSMKLRISATKTARSFSELMNRVRYRGESFVVERGGKPICEILPAQPPKFSGRELADLLRSLPKPDEEYLALVERLMANQSTVAEPKWLR